MLQNRFWERRYNTKCRDFNEFLHFSFSQQKDLVFAEILRSCFLPLGKKPLKKVPIPQDMTELF